MSIKEETKEKSIDSDEIEFVETTNSRKRHVGTTVAGIFVDEELGHLDEDGQIRKFTPRKTLKPGEYAKPAIYYTKDPVFMTEIRNPVANKYCGHVYDFDCMKKYLIACSKKSRASVFKHVKCPVGGCSNQAKLCEEHVVPCPEFFEVFKNLKQG